MDIRRFRSAEDLKTHYLRLDGTLVPKTFLEKIKTRFISIFKKNPQTEALELYAQKISDEATALRTQLDCWQTQINLGHSLYVNSEEMQQLQDQLQQLQETHDALFDFAVNKEKEAQQVSRWRWVLYVTGRISMSFLSTPIIAVLHVIIFPSTLIASVCRNVVSFFFKNTGVSEQISLSLSAIERSQVCVETLAMPLLCDFSLTKYLWKFFINNGTMYEDGAKMQHVRLELQCLCYALPKLQWPKLSNIKGVGSAICAAFICLAKVAIEFCVFIQIFESYAMERFYGGRGLVKRIFTMPDLHESKPIHYASKLPAECFRPQKISTSWVRNWMKALQSKSGKYHRIPDYLGKNVGDVVTWALLMHPNKDSLSPIDYLALPICGDALDKHIRCADLAAALRALKEIGGSLAARQAALRVNQFGTCPLLFLLAGATLRDPYSGHPFEDVYCQDMLREYFPELFANKGLGTPDIVRIIFERNQTGGTHFDIMSVAAVMKILPEKSAKFFAAEHIAQKFCQNPQLLAGHSRRAAQEKFEELCRACGLQCDGEDLRRNLLAYVIERELTLSDPQNTHFVTVRRGINAVCELVAREMAHDPFDVEETWQDFKSVFVGRREELAAESGGIEVALRELAAQLHPNAEQIAALRTQLDVARGQIETEEKVMRALARIEQSGASVPLARDGSTDAVLSYPATVKEIYCRLWHF
ncbi:MAG: hypothetical protein LBC42_01240, partial [Puniceicoccales bacterium]|nr:hypothetical protein [Puniceicoccales bacterium]